MSNKRTHYLGGSTILHAKPVRSGAVLFRTKGAYSDWLKECTVEMPDDIPELLPIKHRDPETSIKRKRKKGKR